ncbi:MAG: tRNA (guanosine(37)-N1)-methyltransferase TrmD [Spirochaetaceae bacterium]|jgi:tRNA (guanine37-N1)-methyltransferase|nr:tRNA (guanosine(37)-N1)-methyltransferase TrmD [Spirochaetaceae bacterium]
MKYTVLTLFPEIIDAYFANSIMARAVKRGIVAYQALNIRDFAVDKHHSCDDAPYGGGAGMLMLAEPLDLALKAAGLTNRLEREDPGEAPSPADKAPSPAGSPSPAGEAPSPAGQGKRVLYLSPGGRPFDQTKARELAGADELVLICGRYEGIDQRIIDGFVDEELSIGDYVLSSGEVAALAVIDATYRLLEAVITPDSLAEESFSGGLLEYPQYTRPEIYATIRVPELLLSGHHEHIRRWRLRKRVEKTLRVRPDLIQKGLESGIFDEETRALIEELQDEPGKTGYSEGEV